MTDSVYHLQDFRVQEDAPESPRILEIHKRQDGELERAIAAGWKPIGRAQNARQRMGMVLNKSSNG